MLCLQTVGVVALHCGNVLAQPDPRKVQAISGHCSDVNDIIPALTRLGCHMKHIVAKWSDGIARNGLSTHNDCLLVHLSKIVTIWLL